MRRDPPIFFFHIPKTAGSTLQHFLRQHIAPTDICPAWTWTTLLNLDKAERSTYKLYQGHFYGRVGSIVNQPCFSFTVLRDPIERALSHYGHVLRHSDHYLHQRAMELGSLDAYLEDPVTKMTVSDFQARMLALDLDIESIYQGLTNEQKAAWTLEQSIETSDIGVHGRALFSAARTKLQSFALVGVTERLSESIALLCRQHAWRYPDTIENQNTNTRRLTREEIARPTLERLVRLNDVDLALYEWTRQESHHQFTRMLAGLINEQAAQEGNRALTRLKRWIN